MKIPLLLSVVVAATAGLQAQVPAAATGSAPSRLVVGGPYVITSRSSDSRVWERWEEVPGPSGKALLTRHRFEECGSGICYFREDEWRDTEELVEAVPGGAVAQRGPHRVLFQADLATAGAIDLEASDGARLVCHPLLLAYFDAATGEYATLGEVKSCAGRVAGNQVIYDDAFTGVSAMMRYTYTRFGVSADLILLAAPEAPEAYGLSSASTKLQLWTEFVQAPPPVTRLQSVSFPDGTLGKDEELIFGAARLGRGKGFGLGAGADARAVPVEKHWKTENRRQFLIEQVPAAAVEAALRVVPRPKGAAVTRTNAVSRTASLRLKLPAAPRRAPAGVSRPMRMAYQPPPTRGYVLDWQAITGSPTNTDFTFRGDTTYFLGSPLFVTGTLTIEGGAVLKYTNIPGTFAGAYVQANGPVVCQTGPFKPAVLTSEMDNSVGEILPWSTGSPVIGRAAGLVLAGGQTIRGLRLAYFWIGVGSWAGMTAEDCQFVNCDCGADLWARPVTLRNVLFSRVTYPLNGSVPWIDVVGEHVTADQFNVFATMNSGLGASLRTLSLTNCLFTQGTNLFASSLNTPVVATNAVAWVPDATGVYQSAGGGDYYLADNSPYRSAGTTNVNPNLLARLRQKTTSPPVVLSNVTLSVETTFAPQAARDTGVPSLGFHYDPLDYVFGGVTADANLTFNPGTVAGWFRTTSGWQHAGHGIKLGDLRTASFHGSATAPCYWVRINTVQERDGSAGYGPGGMTSWSTDAANAPTAQLQFTRCSMLSYDGNHFRDDYGYLKVEATNCEFWSGGDGGYIASYKFVNCLFDRSYVGLGCYASGSFPNLGLSNCTLRGGALYIDHWYSQNWPVSIANCAFDGTTIQMNDYSGGNTNITYCDYNAFLAYSNRLAVTGSHDITNLLSFDWQTGPLGNYYLLTNSPLVNAGSVTNAAWVGLYHFTTWTNQVKEANTALDIAYHYVACTNGVPVDTDGDGIPDYLEDVNGNGNGGDDATSWQSYNSANGLTGPSALQVFTPLKR